MPPTGAGQAPGTKKEKQVRTGFFTKNAAKFDEIRKAVEAKDGWVIDNNQIMQRALDQFLKNIKQTLPGT